MRSAQTELTHNYGVEGYELGTAYGHVALTVDDLDVTLEHLKEMGMEPEKPPYRIHEGGSRPCFVRDPDGYRSSCSGWRAPAPPFDRSRSSRSPLPVARTRTRGSGWVTPDLADPGGVVARNESGRLFDLAVEHAFGLPLLVQSGYLTATSPEVLIPARQPCAIEHLPLRQRADRHGKEVLDLAGGAAKTPMAAIGHRPLRTFESADAESALSLVPELDFRPPARTIGFSRQTVEAVAYSAAVVGTTEEG